ncbi:MAG: Na/Pi symporter, partial [Alphaproteobacteria bacterium]|nr:Na/Pi symporter [Alphaproteobacteria bacterium]
LRLSSQSALQGILGRFTRTPLHGIALGALATAVLQSSSATTALIIGLVNASVLSFGHSIWLIFGSNIGTTMTGWLVSMTGLDLDLKAFALPFVGAGMLMQTFGRHGGWQAAGLALCGFGLFFVGVDILKNAFGSFGTDVTDSLPSADGFFGMLALCGIGFVITVLTQSSSAATALILTATAGGMIGLHGGAAMIIGTNVGTTLTAVISVIGATAHARRTAAAHVLFNAGTGIAALATLPWLLVFVDALAGALGLSRQPVIELALFHTVFNVMGCLIFAPFVPRMTRWLEGLFVPDQPPHPADTRYLDKSAIQMPALALDAVLQELRHFAAESAAAARDAFQSGNSARADALQPLGQSINEYAARLSQEQAAEDVARALQNALRVNRYLSEVLRLCSAAARIQTRRAALPEGHETKAMLGHYLAVCSNLLTETMAEKPPRKSAMTRFNRHYNRMKEELLEDAVRRKMPLNDVSALLDDLSQTRRLLEQAQKARRWLGVIRNRPLSPQKRSDQPIPAAAPAAPAA